MFHSVGRIMRWAGAYRKRMVLGFVCSFFATWCTAGPVVLAAWALGQLIVDAWGEERLSPHLPWLCLGGIVVLILLRFFFTYWKNRLQESIGTERAAEQRMELGNVLKRVSLGYFAKNDLGDILAALTTELSTLELQSMKMVDAVVNGYIQVAVILLCVAFFCPPAALVALIGVLVSAFALRGIGRQSARTAPVGHRAQEALSGAAIEYMDKLAENTISEAEAIAQLTTGVDQISAVVQTNSATSEESAAASEELSSQAFMMKQMVQNFHLRTSSGMSGFDADPADMTPASLPAGTTGQDENRFSKY